MFSLTLRPSRQPHRPLSVSRARRRAEARGAVAWRFARVPTGSRVGDGVFVVGALDGMPKGKHSRVPSSSTRSWFTIGRCDGRRRRGRTLFYLRTKYSHWVSPSGGGSWTRVWRNPPKARDRELRRRRRLRPARHDARAARRDPPRARRRAPHARRLAGQGEGCHAVPMRDVRGDHVGGSTAQRPRTDGGDLLWRPPDAYEARGHAGAPVGPAGAARDVASRSKAMCTVYPGAGARYVRHVNNPDRNGRLLTALLYLNPDWQGGRRRRAQGVRCLRADRRRARERSPTATGGVRRRRRLRHRGDESGDERDTRDGGPASYVSLSGAMDVSEGVRTSSAPRARRRRGDEEAGAEEEAPCV